MHASTVINAFANHQLVSDTKGHTQERSLIPVNIAASLILMPNLVRNMKGHTRARNHLHARYAIRPSVIRKHVGDIKKRTRQRNLFSANIARSASTGGQTARYMSEYMLEENPKKARIVASL